ncbi:MAG: hypothetical protein AAF560_03685 [Acidobacteriota bacterium]
MSQPNQEPASQTQSTASAPKQRNRAKAKRSRAYPAITLKAAIQLVQRQTAQLGPGSFDRETIAKALGHARSSGPAARKIAAMSHYGLLSRANKCYSPTSLAKRLLRSDMDGLAAARKKAFLKPTLFHEVFERYRNEGALPELLGPALASDHGISPAVQEEVASIFRESGVFAGALKADGSFTGPRPVAVDPTRDLRLEPRANSAEAEVRSSEPRQKASIRLSHGKAVLSLPSKLTQSDYQKLTALLSAYALPEDEAPAVKEVPSNVYPMDRDRPR